MNRSANRLHLPVVSSAAGVLLLYSSLSACGGTKPGLQTSAKTDHVEKNVPASKSSASALAAGTQAPPSSALPPVISPFHILADVDYDLDLQRLGKSAVIVASGQLLPIRDNTVTFDSKFALTKEVRGDGVNGAFISLLGTFPDPLFAAVVRPSGRTGLTELYKWTGSTWASHYSTVESISLLDMQPWQNGTMLLVEEHSITGEFAFSVLPKNSKVFIPEPRASKFHGPANVCDSGFLPDSVATLTSGHVFMAGLICSKDVRSDEEQYAIKRWSPQNPKGTADILPEIGKEGFDVVNVALRNENDGYVGGNTKPLRYGQPASLTPYLAHFDGKAWKRDTLPFSDAITSLDVDGQGKLWIVSEKGAVYSRAAGGNWNEITLPVPDEARSTIAASKVWVRGPGDEWIIGTYKSRHVVLHSGTAGEKAQLPDLETMDDAVNELAMPTPLTSRCTTPFALLFTLSKVAPPDFDYPATREALKGHTEVEGSQFVEFKRLDKRYMGAFVPSLEIGKRLVEIVKAKVPSSTPQLVCHAPKPSRVIEIDLRTGE